MSSSKHIITQEHRHMRRKPRKSTISKLAHPVIIAVLVSGVIAITAIALRFPGRIEFRGGNQGVVFLFDGGGKD